MIEAPVDTLIEQELIRSLAQGFLRSPHQKNALFECDAEMITLGDLTLAITTDTISEEIEIGLYRDPYQIGWMAVMVNASDLAAVGAEPIGLVISETLPHDVDAGYLRELQRGIDAASRAIDLPILGGDTNAGKSLTLTGTALGCVRSGPIVTRIGAEPGDLLYTTGPLGAGNAYAAGVLGLTSRSASYLPEARLRQGQLARQFASSAMDTSDGALATLFQLCELNAVGFEISAPLEEYLCPSSKALLDSEIQPWMTLAGPHGEFELIFTLPPDRVTSFLAASRTIDWHPILLGSITASREYRISIFDNRVTLDPSTIRNFALGSQTDVQAMLQGFRALEHHWKEG
jgi:thiamine-monophosphate kinase